MELNLAADMTNEKRNYAGRVLCCFVLILGLAVAAREAPEIATLVDDVSNDGMAVSWIQDGFPQNSSRKIKPYSAHLKSAGVEGIVRDCWDTYGAYRVSNPFHGLSRP